MTIHIDIYYTDPEIFLERMGFVETERKGTFEHKDLPFSAKYVSRRMVYICEKRKVVLVLSVGGPYFPTITIREKVESILPFSEIIKGKLPKEGGKISVSFSEQNIEDVLKFLIETLKIKIIKTEICYGSKWEKQGIEATYIVE